MARRGGKAREMGRRSNPFFESLVSGAGTGIGLGLAAAAGTPLAIKYLRSMGLAEGSRGDGLKSENPEPSPYSKLYDWYHKGAEYFRFSRKNYIPVESDAGLKKRFQYLYAKVPLRPAGAFEAYRDGYREAGGSRSNPVRPGVVNPNIVEVPRSWKGPGPFVKHKAGQLLRFTDKATAFSYYEALRGSGVAVTLYGVIGYDIWYVYLTRSLSMGEVKRKVSSYYAA